MMLKTQHCSCSLSYLQMIFTLRTKLSGTVYCNRSCLWVCLCVCVGLCVCVCVCLWVCYHDNSKLRASILTKLGLSAKVVTISSWLNFGRPAPQRREAAAGRKFLAPPYNSQRAVFASLWALFPFHSVLLYTLLCKIYLSIYLIVLMVARYIEYLKNPYSLTYAKFIPFLSLSVTCKFHNAHYIYIVIASSNSSLLLSF